VEADCIYTQLSVYQSMFRQARSAVSCLQKSYFPHHCLHSSDGFLNISYNDAIIHSNRVNSNKYFTLSGGTCYLFMNRRKTFSLTAKTPLPERLFPNETIIDNGSLERGVER